jgi:CRP-like cAMP-binding protein
LADKDDAQATIESIHWVWGSTMQSLAAVTLFKDAGLEYERFDRRCAWKRFDENEVVVDFEDSSTDLYCIVSGEVRILIRTQSGKEVILGEMRGGQFFGELAAIDDVKRSANVTALTRAEMCIMPAAVFRDIVHRSPVVADRLLRLLTARIRELNARLTEHSVFDLKHRLYAELLRLSTPRTGALNRAGRLAAAVPPCAGGAHRLPARAGDAGAVGLKLIRDHRQDARRAGNPQAAGVGRATIRGLARRQLRRTRRDGCRAALEA